MNLLSLVKNWKDVSFVWSIIQPFVVKLIRKNVPNSKTKLYENIAKAHQPLLDSLYKLKNKITTSPNKLDDECFNIGISALEAYSAYLTEEIQKLKS